MLSLRGFEQRAEKLFAADLLKGSTHLGIGQEAIAVGARWALRDGDLVVPTYRGHNFALAWGTPLEPAFAELLGRVTGCNLGRGGSKHFGDPDHRVLPGNAIVAAQLPIACGTALKAKLDGEDTVTVVPFGDGATNQAAWHEALNLAAVWDLPVIFLCENNLYSEMTPIGDAVKIVDLADRADGYGINADILDGMDVEAMAAGVGQAAARARAGHGPTLLEAKTYRFCGHMTGDAEPYRARAEVESWQERDPLKIARQRLAEGGVAEAELLSAELTVEGELAAAEEAAREAAFPSVDDLALGTATWMGSTR